MNTIGTGFSDRYLTKIEIEHIIVQSLACLSLKDQKILIIIPDHTRTIPLALFFRLLTKYLCPYIRSVDFLVALGTHPSLSKDALLNLVGLTAEEKVTHYPEVRLLNHAWDDPQALVTLGTISADKIAELSNGMFQQDVPVRLNRAILDYDQILICGPIFPHEVAGFSGGNKYFFPGIAGGDIINLMHWLGALITSYETIGTKDTAVRRLIDLATDFIPIPRYAFCSVTTPVGVAGLFFGTPEGAFSVAADLSARRHILWMEYPFQTVLAILPEMYDEIWVGAKGMYKTEPVIADGGEVILYAPHINKISYTHGQLIDEIGYHVRDYFVQQWERFKHYPWGVLAHSTHLRGLGTYQNGVEHSRIQVTLATGLPPEQCKRLCLGYRDPASIHPEEWSERQEEGVLVVPHAGEILYRLKSQEAKYAAHTS